MANRRTAWLLVLLALVAGTAIYYLRWRPHYFASLGFMWPPPILAPGPPRMPSKHVHWTKEQLKQFMRPHLALAGPSWLPDAYPKAVSEWQANQKEVYADLLKGRKFDVLVVPVQVQDYALDRPTRSLMTAELSRAIGRARSIPMPDPYLVERALGDGARRLNIFAVRAFAKRIGAKRIVMAYVGHDRHHRMTLTIVDRVKSRNGYLMGPVGRNHQPAPTYENLVFSDQHPPIEVYESLLPRVLRDLDYDPKAGAPSKIESAFTDKGLPPTPFDLTRGADQPARDAYFFQVLGALTPRREERTRERMFEKSLLAIRRMTPASPQYRALKARAFMYLGQRPAALAALGSPASAEEKELYAALNGNLPQVNSLAAQQTQLVTLLLAELDANSIAADYGVATRKGSVERAAALKLPGDFWPAVTGRAFVDWDVWALEQNIILKLMLDKNLPLAGYTAEGIVRGGAALADPDKVKTSADLSVLEHVRRLLASEPGKWCCEMRTDGPSPRDYLDFIQATATDNLMREANFFTNVQGNPEQALEFLDRIGSVYKGYPEYALQRAYAEYGVARRSDGVERGGRLKSAYVDALNAFYWSNGQTRVAADAFPFVGRTGRSDYGFLSNIYAPDYPFRSFYSDWEHGGQLSFSIPNARAALENSLSDFQPVRELGFMVGDLQHKQDEVDAIIESIRGRFAGCPDRDAYLAERSLSKSDIAGAETHYRAGIKDAPGVWSSYEALGTLLFRQGETAKSARVFMNYPGFRKDSGEGPVALSNDAFTAGSLFYWAGEFELAKPLYRIAADLKTGSNASLTGQIRLELMAGDISGALAGSLERARHYDEPHAYRDYLGMLHAMGRSKTAWSAFDVLVQRLRAPQLWETALVGQRIERKSESEIAAWAAESRFAGLGESRSATAAYLVRAATTDRTPSGKLAKRVAALAWPVWQLPKWHDYVVRVRPGGNAQAILGPAGDYTHGSTLPVGVFDAQVKEPVKSDLLYFASAYRALRTGEASKAWSILKEASSYYYLAEPQVSYLTPYFAFAAAKSGHASAAQEVLDAFKPDDRGFDYYLARGVIAGLRGDTRNSLGLLKLALFRRPYTEERPVYTEYEYAEIVDWLYRETHKAEYRRLALDWARKVETFTPWYAWPYAMQAELDHDKAGRRRAIAMAAYLDPGSERLAKLPKAEVARAVRAFKGLNPFLRLSASAQKKSGI